jgi:hypothetical protein
MGNSFNRATEVDSTPAILTDVGVVIGVVAMLKPKFPFVLSPIMRALPLLVRTPNDFTPPHTPITFSPANK